MPDRLPRYVFHLAEEANFASIQRYGLLCANALLDLAGIEGEERSRLEQRQPTASKLVRKAIENRWAFDSA